VQFVYSKTPLEYSHLLLIRASINALNRSGIVGGSNS
jgi:hypothetical protein